MTIQRFLALTATAALVAGAACREEGTAERLGEALDETASEAVEAAEEGLDEAAEAVEEVVDETSDRVRR